MRKILSISLFAACCFAQTLSGQYSDPDAFNTAAMIHITRESQSDGSYTGKVYVKAPGTYTVAFTYANLQNTLHEDHFIVKVKEPGTIFTMRPIDSQSRVTFSNSSTWVLAGELNPKNPQTDFVYRLPVSTHKETRVGILRRSKKEVDESVERPVEGLSFNMLPGDTIFAPRKGLVVRIPGTFQLLPSSAPSRGVSLMIEHGDGTRVWFTGLKDAEYLVERGEKVIPGTPLAVIRETTASQNSVAMRIEYLTGDVSRFGSETQSPFQERKNNRINPVLALPDGNRQITASGSYKAVETPELVRAELSKREIKQLKSKN